MKRLKKDFVISFAGLKVGSHQFKYQIGKTFFEAFKYDDFLDSDVQVVLDFEKTERLFELSFKASGCITVACDLTNEAYDESINSDLELVVKFGEAFNDENESILVLPHSAYEFNISQYIYEMLVLAMPVKRIHPGIAKGTLKSDILQKLQELAPKQSLVKKKEDDIDPRWAKLKTLRTEKKE
jgi:DUF177 domain-containing protein